MNTFLTIFQDSYFQKLTVIFEYKDLGYIWSLEPRLLTESEPLDLTQKLEGCELVIFGIFKAEFIHMIS